MGFVKIAARFPNCGDIRKTEYFFPTPKFIPFCNDALSAVIVVADDVVDFHGRRLPGRARGTTMFFANKRLVQISKPGQVIVPIMGKTFHLTLDGFDLGQILDGLRCRHESWANTAIYLRDDYFPDDSFACESVAALTKRKRSPIIISESSTRSNGKLTSRVAGKSSRSEVHFGETRALPSRIQKCRRLYDVDLGRGVEFRFANRKLVTG